MHLSHTDVFEGSQCKGSANKWISDLFLAGSLYFEYPAGGCNILGSGIPLQTNHTPSRLFYYHRKWQIVIGLFLCMTNM